MGQWHHEDDRELGTLTVEKEQTEQDQSQRIPRYHVVLWDSDHHTYDYVERMLRELFGHEREMCHQLAERVDTDGRATVLTTTREHAELKRDQVLAYGRDSLAGCQGSMWATIEKDES